MQDCEGGSLVTNSRTGKGELAARDANETMLVSPPCACRKRESRRTGTCARPFGKSWRQVCACRWTATRGAAKTTPSASARRNFCADSGLLHQQSTSRKPGAQATNLRLNLSSKHAWFPCWGYAWVRLYSVTCAKILGAGGL